METPCLNCSTLETAKQSIAGILGISQQKLLDELDRIDSILQSHDVQADEFQDIDDFIKTIKLIGHHDTQLQCMLSKTENPMLGLWFHSTRTHDPKKIRDKGLLPTSVIKEHLHQLLENLSHGLTQVGEYKNLAGANAKISMGKSDDGPHALLFKNISNENYFFRSPEIIEDLSGAIIGANSDLLIQRYKEISRPCVVIFFAPINQYHFLTAFFWIFLSFKKQPPEYLLDIITTPTFNGKGVPIAPDEIYDIEFIDNHL